MSRECIPYATADVSALAKSLRAQLKLRVSPPTHVEMLNMLARAAGHRNFQHLRAQASDPGAPERIGPNPSVRADSSAVLRAARYFDDHSRLVSWPARTSLQNLCLWVLWSRIPRDRVFDERGISALLTTLHLFGDPAILRRAMCALGLLARTIDGRRYHRIEQPPSPEGRALIRRIATQRNDAAVLATSRPPLGAGRQPSERPIPLVPD